MDLNVAKVVALSVLGLGSIFFGLLPAALKEYNLRRRPTVETVLLCFGAGILLATSIVHMLTEVAHDIPDIAQIVFCCGFLLVYLTDELLHFCCDHATISQPTQIHDESQPILRQSASSYGSTDDSATHLEPTRNTLVGVIGMFTALLIHSFLEGLAIGVQATTARVMILFIAVLSHKLVVAFCFGVELSASPGSTFKQHFLVIFVFSAGSVVGILVGMGLVDMSTVSNSKLLPVLQGIAGGTLLYVTLCEVLPRERARCLQNMNSNKYTGLVQFLSLSLGFSVMTLMNTYISDGD